MKTYYNITKEEYNNMFAEQGGKCAVCGRHQSDLNHTLVIDHDHVTGKVRGLLCMRCNTGIGFLGDSVYSLAKALEYLSR
jgi:hypothetical protein